MRIPSSSFFFCSSCGALNSLNFVNREGFVERTSCHVWLRTNDSKNLVFFFSNERFFQKKFNRRSVKHKSVIKTGHPCLYVPERTWTCALPFSSVYEFSIFSFKAPVKCPSFPVGLLSLSVVFSLSLSFMVSFECEIFFSKLNVPFNAWRF